MKEFLVESVFTDVSSPIIEKAANTITKSHRSTSDKAVAIFEWVQDHSKYSLGLFSHKASETLIEAYGSCTNKANLLVALCRAAGIPASFRIMVVDAKEYLGPPSVKRLKRLLGNKSLHIFAAVYIDDCWFDVDPSDDVRLSLAGSHVWPQVLRVRFDGCSDARLNLHPDHILKEPESYETSIDHIFLKRPTKGNEIIETFNDYTDFMRRRLILYDSCEAVFDEFLEWYRVNYPVKHIAFHEAEERYLSNIELSGK